MATLVKPRVGLFLIIFSMLLSPEITVGKTVDRDLIFRFEDILLFLVVFSWMIKAAITKHFDIFKRTPITKPILIYIAILIVSTLLGILVGYIYFPSRAFFYLIKYMEYYLLYFMVVNLVKFDRDAKVFLFCLFLTCIITSIYAGFICHQERVTAPFDSDGYGGGGEPNTLGGYLLFIFAIAFAYLLGSNNIYWRLFSGIVCVLAVKPFLNTLSRGSYLAVLPMYLMTIFYAKKYRILLIMVCIFFFVFIDYILPGKVFDRIESTFMPGKTYETLLGTSITLDDSASARVETWKNVFDQLKQSPLLGKGVTGVSFIDSQFARVLGEVGIIGLIVFIWLLVAIFRASSSILKYTEDNFLRCLISGFLAGYVALIVHGFSGSTFIIIRTMEPFWFILAVIMSSLAPKEEFSA